MTPEEEIQLESEYDDRRRYQETEIEIYDTKGEYSHTEEFNRESK